MRTLAALATILSALLTWAAAAQTPTKPARIGCRWRHDESPSGGSAFLFPSLQWNDFWVAARHLAPWIYRPGRATRCI